MNNTGSRKIGILGGTFNPIHIGHLILAQNAFDYCKLDEVLIMPSGVSYFKDPKEIIETAHRIELVKLSIKNNPNFRLSTIETEREGNSYTYETLEALKSNSVDEYYYICGADTLFNIETWKKPEIIMKNAILVCALRNGISYEDLNAKATYLKDKFNAQIIIMNIPEIEVSSSSIRRMLKNNMSCKYYLKDEALEYIKSNSLYDGV